MPEKQTPKSNDPKHPVPAASIDPSGSTMINGAPAGSDQNSLSLSPNGPLLLHDVHLVDQLAHFNRENVPERKPHAKGSGAFGEFEVTGDVTRYTKAGVFSPGRKTRMLARFSTVAGELGSPDTWRDVRGFALRFYAQEGNYDLVGNNTPVFFVRDPMKFPHFIRSQKRKAADGLRNLEMQWDFWTLNPESAHQVTYLMGDRGLPRSWREMNGYGSHTYMWVNESGERFWVKYHFHTQQGVKNIDGTQAEKIAGLDADFHRRDLFEHIEQGDFPKWKLSVQVMPYEDAKTYRFNPFDLTKTWSHADYPLIEVGTMTLNENPTNHNAQIEQAAFAPSNTVPGIGFSPDKMLLGRVFAYADAHRARIGTNFDHLPVNRPICPVNTYHVDGHMNVLNDKDEPTYAANSVGRSYSDFDGKVDDGWEADGEMVRSAYVLHPEDDDFGQAGTLVREVFDDAQRERLVETIAGQMTAGPVKGEVRERVYWYWTQVDAEIGRRIKETVDKNEGGDQPGADANDAKAVAEKFNAGEKTYAKG